MTVRVTINRVCDRCQKPFEGGQYEYGDTLPEYDRSKLVLTREHIDGKTGEVTEKVLMSLSDLCPQCDGVVEKAVHKLRMDPSPKKDSEQKDSEQKDSDRLAAAKETAAKAAKEAKAKKKAEEAAPPPEPEPTPEPVEDTPEEEDPPF
jgi:hypothetical protein